MIMTKMASLRKSVNKRYQLWLPGRLHCLRHWAMQTFHPSGKLLQNEARHNFRTWVVMTVIVRACRLNHQYSATLAHWMPQAGQLAAQR